MIVSQLWQYPVKGLAGMTLDSIRLEAGKHFPGDRRFAVTNGHPKQDEALAGRWVKKSFFLQMMKFEELAAFDCDMAGEVMTLSKDGEEILAADLATEPGIRLVNEFFAARFADRLGGLPQLARVTDGAFTDTKGAMDQPRRHSLGGPVWRGHRHPPDARRFRLNIMLETDTPFEEASLIGTEVRLGEAVLRVEAPVGRCAAIDVDPETAVRGPHYLPLMQREFGHTDLGIFAEVTEGGLVRPGDRLTRLG